MKDSLISPDSACSPYVLRANRPAHATGDQDELDLTVSVGLSLSKGLCKIASDYRKPNGFTAVRGRHIHLFLQRIPTEEVWGLGPNSVQMLQKYGVHTAYDFVQRPENGSINFSTNLIAKSGTNCKGKAFTSQPRTQTNVSIDWQRKTFSTPSRDPQFVYAKLVVMLNQLLLKCDDISIERQVIFHSGIVTIDSVDLAFGLLEQRILPKRFFQLFDASLIS